MLKRDELNEGGSCLRRAHDDEMVFVLLARDKAAPAAIRAWIAERIKLGKNTADDEQIKDAERCAVYMSSKNVVSWDKWRAEFVSAYVSMHGTSFERALEALSAAPQEWFQAWLDGDSARNAVLEESQAG